ncbi:MAG: mannitol dehydrogenase family protein [Clostridia bacterium]|nr:mannitol dehydrogenase family protein [Clostridia bacterium]
MKLTYEGLRDVQAWEKAGVLLPPYDPRALSERTRQHPLWVHFGIGNIFRIFIGSIADRLVREGAMDRGVTCVETFDYDVVDKIYAPFDNLVMAVTLNGDGTREKRVLGVLGEAVKAQSSDPASWVRLKEIFTDPGLEMVSFTITEKGYALRNPDGAYFGYVQADLDNGPEKVTGAMGVVTAMLYARYKAGKHPLTLVSMDNVARNGEKLRASVLETARVWAEKGHVPAEFTDYVSDEKVVSFPWTMIDKITPRPSEDIAADLMHDGIENMQPVITSRHTYIAPFANAEGPQYLVVEDNFPNGRPPLERAGVYMADRETVNRSERMKVTACLNPIHTALGPYDVMLGHELFADGMSDPELSRLAHQVGYMEGLPVVQDPGILSPKAFIDEVINERFPNKYLGDTSQRICTDASMGMAFRFGETVKAYVAKDGTAAGLIGIPLAIAGWLRYTLALDDAGAPYTLAPDPLAPGIHESFAGIELGRPETFTDQLRPILSNVNIFGVDLYQAGIGEKIETIFREELAGPGAVRATLKKYLDAI